MSKSNGQAQGATAQATTAEQSIGVKVVALLDVIAAEEIKSRRKRLVITVGASNGTVESFGLDLHDGQKLLQQLLSCYRTGGAYGDPQQLKAKFCLPHSIGRAETDYKGHGPEPMLRKLWKDMPELGEFVIKELKDLERSINHNGKSPKAAKTIVKRLTRAMLLAVDAARIDT
jgi:hypothetical protein